MTRITEGAATFEADTARIPSREQPLFYNPVMRRQRDMTLLLLYTIGSERDSGLQCCDALAGSGVRAIRMLNELPEGMIEHVTINDHAPEAVAGIKKNLKTNKIVFEEWNRDDIFNASLKRDGPGARGSKTPKGRTKIILPPVLVTTMDAGTLLHACNGYDYIELDPFGSPNPFLDAACKRISREGILALTITDTAPLAGVYPKTCMRKYWGAPCTGIRKHEVGLRIAVRKAQLVAAQYEKALVPILCYHEAHYYRLIFRCEKSKAKADEILKQHGRWEQEPKAGPLWLGPMVVGAVLKKMIMNLEGLEFLEGNLEEFLNLLIEENQFKSIPFYYNLNELTGVKKKELLEQEGVSRTHLDQNAIRSEKRF